MKLASAPKMSKPEWTSEAKIPTLPVCPHSQNFPMAMKMPKLTARAVIRRVMIDEWSGGKRPGRPRLFG